MTNARSVKQEFMVMPPLTQDQTGLHMDMAKLDKMSLAMLSGADLQAGNSASSELTFTEPTSAEALEFACHTPGHYEVNMKLPKSKQSILQWIGDHWFATFLIVYGLWVFTPFLAPVFMHAGWTGAGKVVYFIYSFFCHQLPERSFFFFGEKSMYSLAEIQTVWQSTVNPMILRRFTGNEIMGWKVAWSDRMISFYTSIWLFALIWYPFRRKLKPIPWWGFALLLLPILLDGSTHAVSDLAGIGQGFRDTNAWLAAITSNSFPASFYAGDALGSFNSTMRFLTGLLAGLGIVWLSFPYILESRE